MIYLTSKKDKEIVEAFLLLVKEFWEVENQINDRNRRASNAERSRYQELRETVARKIPKIIHISRRAGIPDILHSHPAPAVGGPVIPVNIYESILQDDSHGRIPNQRKLDTLNRLIGQLEGKIDFEFKKIVNPVFWLSLCIEKILRIPFWLLSKTGFQITKLEDHFLGKLFKLIEIGALIYISLKLGIPDSWVTALLGGTHN